MLVHAHDGRIYHLHRGVMFGSQGIHDPIPNASLPPANEAIIASRVWAKALWQIAPRCARPQDPKDAVENTPIIYTLHALRN
jgi:hypothetical protein